ncbi:hypothetical protein OAA76_03730 [Planktotalea frisia]|nr:hypothetical protein [Planktotalea frisia]
MTTQKPNTPPESNTLKPSTEARVADPKVATEGGHGPVGKVDDPFDLSNISVAGVTSEDLGVEKPILVVPVDKPSKQDFFRTHPDPSYHLEARVLKVEAERETYLVTKDVWVAIPGETKLVRLVPFLTRTGGLGLWPVPLLDDLLGKKDTNWGITARGAAELAETKWVRMQANMARNYYDVVSSDKIPDPVWPKITSQDILKIAFGDGRLIDRMDHPVIRQLQGW